MAQIKQIWSPLCTKYISAGHIQDADLGFDETHLEFQTQGSDQFILKLSSTEVTKLWEGLSLLLQTLGFPSGSESSEQH